MKTAVCDSLSNINSTDWNQLIGNDNPFARYEFLRAMEVHEAVGEKYGWIPQYLLVKDADKLVGAAPLYLKYNSYGEFVFDWAWADAYERSGLNYYPKLVASIPYTPATGNRLFIHPEYDHELIASTLINASIEHAEKLGVSSLHWLFPDEKDTRYFEYHPDFMMRLGCQFHWHNQGYENFEQYLATFRSSKRKKVRRERKYVREQEININVLSGNEISEEQWEKYYYFYASTFARKSGIPTFSKAFFQQIGETMPENIVLVMADYNNDYVAGAFNMRGEKSLFGRHWGCLAEFHSLHFEACYYQGLEYAIAHHLDRFEPGAQGEHKISRGFLPTETWSAHWIADQQFKEAISNFLEHEKSGMRHYIKELREHSPFKAGS
ncbi:MAG: GNAT family N-acetyltransferase [Gammaproteobacteria bacterium]